MKSNSIEDRQRVLQLDRAALRALQLEKLNRVLREVCAENEFYKHKLVHCPEQVAGLDELSKLPETTKGELHPPAGAESFAANRTWPLERYVRWHQTSGTRGRPLAVLDTAEDWQWWIDTWQYVLDAAGVTPNDRALLAFSFGPFIGFWSAFDALTARGALVVPAGGLSSIARLELIRTAGITTLFCTPTYALRLAEVAEEQQVNLAQLPVERIIVAGEPGGSVPATRARIEAVWQARVFDHGGATEVGPWGFADRAGRGLFVNEAEFIAEFVSVDSGKPAKEGELSHLIITTLGRLGAPLIRYRTGDIVRPVWHHPPPRSGEGLGEGRSGKNEPGNEPSPGPSLQGRGGCNFVLLDGGILGRSDDMVIIRGMNVYPGAIEQILHSFPEVVEHRITARRRGELDELIVEVEDHLQQPERIAKELCLRLGLTIDVHAVSAMSLPRFEGKGARFVDER